MKKNYLYLILIIAIAILTIVNRDLFGLGGNILTSEPLQGGLNFFPVIDYHTNAYHLWRLDPITLELVKIFKPINLANAALISWLIFFLGSALLLARASSLEFKTFLTAIFLNLGLFLSFGNNILIAGAFSWLPWYILFLSKYNQSLISKIISFIFLLLIFLSANQYSLIIFLLAFFINSELFPEQNQVPFTHKVAVIFASLSSFCIPLPIFPDYPGLGRVVEDDGLPGIIRPLIGPDSPIQIISLEQTKLAYKFHALILPLLTLVFSAKYFYQKNKLVFGYFLFIAIAILIDFFGSAHLATLGPIKSVSRLTPGFSSLALNVFTIAVLIISSVYILSKNPRSSLFLSVLFAVLAGINSYFLNPQVLNLPKTISKRLTSPSLYIYKNEGYELALNPNKFKIKKRIPLRKETASLSASANNSTNKLRRITDISEATRWSTGLGKQNGDEWLLINLVEPVNFSGIELKLGKFRADFPRALKIYAKEKCENNEISTWKNKDDYLLKSDIPWQGAINFTNDGYPYYGSQSDIVIFFNNSVNASCILVEQVGKTPAFEWSITGINLLQN